MGSLSSLCLSSNRRRRPTLRTLFPFLIKSCPEAFVFFHFIVEVIIFLLFRKRISGFAESCLSVCLLAVISFSISFKGWVKEEKTEIDR